MKSPACYALFEWLPHLSRLSTAFPGFTGFCHRQHFSTRHSVITYGSVTFLLVHLIVAPLFNIAVIFFLCINQVFVVFLNSCAVNKAVKCPLNMSDIVIAHLFFLTQNFFANPAWLGLGNEVLSCRLCPCCQAQLRKPDLCK